MYVVGTKKNHLTEMVLLSTQNLCLNSLIRKYSKFHAKNCMYQAPRYECLTENYFFYFSTRTYVVGTQKNSLNETVLLSTKNTCLK